MAQPGGLVRLYIDMGPRMAELLVCLRHVAPDFIDQVLAVPVMSLSSPATQASQTIRSGLSGFLTVRETLTAREMDVLELLAQRLTDKEIAARLYVTERTVSRHAENIYQKLGVGNRREAVAAAVAQGILPLFSGSAMGAAT